MRAFIIGLVIAAGMVFLLMPMRTVRYAVVDHAPSHAAFEYGPAPGAVPETPRPPRPISTVRTVKRGTNDMSFQELKVTGPARPTKELAYEDAYVKAARAVQDLFCMRSELTPDDIKSFVRDQPSESTVPLGKDKDGKDLGEAVQVDMTLHIDQDSIAKLADFERDNRMTQRMHLLARSLAVLVAGFFAVAGYVRLDEWSKGYYSGLLKALAVVAVVSIGLAVWLR